MQARRYVIELMSTIILYGLVLVAVNLAARHGMVPAGWEVPVALLPMLPCMATAFVILRHIRRVDEFQRRIQFEAVAFAFVGTALLSLTYGFLEGQGFPRLSMFSVWPLMGGLWAVGLFISLRRYR